MSMICLKCKKELIKRDQNFFCSSCKHTYHSFGGIISFIDSKNKFYEGKYTETRDFESLMPKFLGPLRYPLYRLFTEVNMVTIAERFFRHRLFGNKDLKILDVACGGGWKCLTEYGEVTGIDLSLSSLKNSKKIYNNVYQADAFNLPFSNESFDVIVGMDFFEHIKTSKKQELLNELKRVLKSNGKIMMGMPMVSREKMARFTRSYSDLYKKYWIDQDDHVGLETPREIISHFRKTGFKVIKTYNYWVNLLMPLSYLKYLDNEYRMKSKFIDLNVRFSKFIVKHNVLFGIYAFFMGPIADLIDYVAPMNYGMGFMICAQKF